MQSRIIYFGQIYAGRVIVFYTHFFLVRYDNVPPEINKLRCRVNYHALQFLPEIEHMADQLVSRMRNRTNSTNPFM